MNVEKAKHSKFGQSIYQTNIWNHLNYKPQVLLTIMIIEEKAKLDSFWKPYLDILPTDMKEFPYFLEDQELELLESSDFSIKLMQQKKYFKEDWELMVA